ncbi:gas vesicle protein [Methanoregula sp.]|uniref:gas vesicle protein n=1 Tax=Methanoregula sp. TaxID=2052170 RepID=UPI003565C0D5
MDATRERRTTLVDLLDRVLEKGAVIDADVIITVAGVPLIGLKLRAMLASIETMIQYGMWADWDRAIRAAACDEEKRKIASEKALLAGETPAFQCAASYWQSNSTCPAWTYGTLTITDRAIRIHRREPLACLVAIRFEDLAGYSLEYGTVSVSAEPTGYLHLGLTDGSVCSLHPAAAEEVICCIGAEMNRKNIPWAPVECQARMPENYRKCIVKEV